MKVFNILFIFVFFLFIGSAVLTQESNEQKGSRLLDLVGEARRNEIRKQFHEHKETDNSVMDLNGSVVVVSKESGNGGGTVNSNVVYSYNNKIQ